MDKSTIIARLREHEPELRAAGVEHLSLFGSYARGTAVEAVSDVDLMADFDKTKRYTLLTMGRLENRIAELFGTKVDLSSPEWIKESVRNLSLIHI